MREKTTTSLGSLCWVFLSVFFVCLSFCIFVFLYFCLFVFHLTGFSMLGHRLKDESRHRRVDHLQWDVTSAYQGVQGDHLSRLITLHGTLLYQGVSLWTMQVLGVCIKHSASAGDHYQSYVVGPKACFERRAHSVEASKLVILELNWQLSLKPTLSSIPPCINLFLSFSLFIQFSLARCSRQNCNAMNKN